MVINSIEASSKRRARGLRQSASGGVAISSGVTYYESDIFPTNVSAGAAAASPDTFILSMLGDPSQIFANAQRPALQGGITLTRIMASGSGISVETPGYPPPSPPCPPPPPACEVYDPCFSWRDVEAQCVSVDVSLNHTEGWKCLDCPTGFSGNGTHCDDVDECLGDNGGCDERTTCTNEYGGRTCGVCPEGFTGNGASESGGCVDTNECAVNNGGCDFYATCYNTPGGFYCGDCPSGFSGTGDTQCIDINECEDAAACDPLTMCTNTAGDFTCTDCPPGYFGSGKSECTFITSCEPPPCDPQTTCTELSDRVACSACPTGFSGTGFTGCVDIDGCAATASAPTGPCFPGVQCTDVKAPELGFTCGPCPAGYVGEYAIGELGCKFDLCPLGAACSVDPKVTCTMVTATQFSCSPCPAGYSGDGYVDGSFPGCEDIDECAVNNPCDGLTSCSNLRGGVECGDCLDGYVGTGKTGCQEVT
ncbi:hypothetical protein CYMTET_26538, partial [Cymbomonas tetramitiformis]